MKVAVATTTFYRDIGGKDAVRFNCVKQQVLDAVCAGHEIVVIDGSPNPDVGKALQMIGSKVFRQQGRGMGQAKRESFFHASFCGDIIVANEAEKYDLIRHIPKLIAPIEEKIADIVVARRTPKSDATYPEFQIATEREADEAFERVTSLTGVKPMFGPVAFAGHRALPAFVMWNPNKVPGLPDTYVQHYAPLVAHFGQREGAVVKSVAVDFEYPPGQRAEEDAALNEEIRQKRIYQRDTLIKAYGTLMDYLDPKGLLRAGEAV